MERSHKFSWETGDESLRSSKSLSKTSSWGFHRDRSALRSSCIFAQTLRDRNRKEKVRRRAFTHSFANWDCLSQSFLTLCLSLRFHCNLSLQEKAIGWCKEAGPWGQGGCGEGGELPVMPNKQQCLALNARPVNAANCLACRSLFSSTTRSLYNWEGKYFVLFKLSSYSCYTHLHSNFIPFILFPDFYWLFVSIHTCSTAGAAGCQQLHPI